MKRTIIILALAALTSAAGAEEKTKTYSFNDIERIEASYNYKVFVTRGNSYEVEVRCHSELERFMTVSYSDMQSKLTLRMENLPKRLRNRELPAIEVYVQMDEIFEIDLSGASEIYFDGEFSTIQLDADLSGASNIYDLAIKGRDLNLDCSGASNADITGDFTGYVDIDCSGASKVRFDGKAGKLDGDFSGACIFDAGLITEGCNIDCSGAAKTDLTGEGKSLRLNGSGACEIDARNFRSKTVKVDLSGISSAKVHATEELHYNVSRSCKMTYYGDAELFNLSEENNIVKGSF